MSIQFAPRWTIPNLLHTCIVGNATDIASSDESTLLDLKVNNVSKFTVDKFGEMNSPTLTPLILLRLWG